MSNKGKNSKEKNILWCASEFNFCNELFTVTHNYAHVYPYQLIAFIHTIWHNSLMGEILTDVRLCWVSVKIFPVNIFHQQLEQLDTAHKVDIEY